MIDELTEVKVVDYTPQTFSSLSSLNAYEIKKDHFIRSNGITYHSFNLLLVLYNHWFYIGTGMTLYGIIGIKNHCAYQSTYNKLTTLSKHCFVSCSKRSDGVNIFTPTLKAIEGINGLLISE